MLEARVTRLEEQVALLMRERGGDDQPSRDAWQRTVGMFRGDPVFGEMIAETERRHEEERRLTRDAIESDVE
jgi:hypothetical protein